MDSIVHYNVNQRKCESYVTNLNDSNFENDLNTTIASTSIERDYINTGCVYNDIDNQRQNLILQLLFAVVNIKLTIFTTNQPTSTIISYCSSGQLVLLNNWEDPHYLTSAFFCLFPFGIGGHLEQWKGPMFLEAWVK